MSDQYAHVVKSSLKLKSKGPSDSGISKKKKKKVKSSSAVEFREKESTDATSGAGGGGGETPSRAQQPPSRPAVTKTKAELKFHEMQEKRQMARIMKKAEKSHKQQVEDFNKHLDSLSEHYDIPKVSWTK